MALGLADHLAHTQLLQVQGDEGGGAHIHAHSHYSAVVVTHAQGTEHRRVPGIAGDGMGDLVSYLLYILL